MEHINQRGIIYYNVLVDGSQGSGKTKCAEAIVEEAVKIYGEHNVNAVKSRKNLKLLLDNGINNKPIQILFADDLTLSKVNLKELENFYNVRHLLEEKGRDTGLIITIIALHDFFAIPKHLRSFFNFLIVCNPPTNQYDRKFISNYIGIDNLKLLEKIYRSRKEDVKYYGYKIFWSLGLVGILYTPLAKKDYFRTVRKSIKQILTPKTSYSHKPIDVFEPYRVNLDNINLINLTPKKEDPVSKSIMEIGIYIVILIFLFIILIGFLNSL